MLKEAKSCLRNPLFIGESVMSTPTKIITSLVSLLCMTGYAWGYSHDKTSTGQLVRWHQKEIRYHISSKISESIPGDNAEHPIIESFKTWQRPLGNRLNLQFGGFVSGQEDAEGFSPNGPNKNVLRWEKENWVHGNETVAITLLTYVSTTGEIKDADIIFNEVNHRFTVQSSPLNDTPRTNPLNVDPNLPVFDVGNVATHETGHFLGLNHSEHMGATMFATTLPGEVHKRDLHEDDKNGILALYANAEDTIPAPTTETAPALPSIPSLPEVPAGFGFTCSTQGTSAPVSVPLSLLMLFVGFGLFARRRQVSKATTKNLFLALLFAGGLISLFPQSAQATTAKWLNLKTLTTHSQRVVIGKVVHQQSQWHKRYIVTLSTLKLEKCLKKTCTSSYISVLQYGGKVGAYRQRILGAKLLTPNQRVLLFLRPAIRTQVALASPTKGLPTPIRLLPLPTAAPSPSKTSAPVFRVVGLSQGHFRFVQSTTNPKQTLLQSDRRELTFIKHTKQNIPTTQHGQLLRIPSQVMLKRIQSLTQAAKTQ